MENHLITLVSLIICNLYIFFPNSYKVTADLKRSKQNLYYEFKYLNDILKQSEDGDRLFQIDSKNVFEMFINEFRDYDG